MAEVQVIPPKAARPDTLRVAAYCRVSSDSADQLHSYAAQIRAYTQAINAHDGWDLVDIYADEGLTGTRMDKREDFNRLMADCRKGKIDKIVVKSISRFARNTRDCLATLRELSSLGVTVKFEKENIDTGTHDADYFAKMAEELRTLLIAVHGHALVLFTSYAAMSAVKDRLKQHPLPFPLFTMGRNAPHTMAQFKAAPGSVLFATGAAWEGFDFPGDCVSLLVIPRLPFQYPDALQEKKREAYPDLRTFIRAVAVPEMQIRLKQGFGRAIRLETDTCAIAILDERAAKGSRYFRDVQSALPEMPVTSSIYAVERFIRRVKDESYFEEAA